MNLTLAIEAFVGALDPEDYDRTEQAALVRLCSELDQVVLGAPGDLVAYLRCGRATIDMIAAHDFAGFLRLGISEITHGPILFIVATAAQTPGWLFRTLRTLGRMPGVRLIAGERVNRGLCCWRPPRGARHAVV